MELAPDFDEFIASLTAPGVECTSWAFTSWNRVVGWLRQLEAIRVAA